MEIHKHRVADRFIVTVTDNIGKITVKLIQIAQLLFLLFKMRLVSYNLQYTFFLAKKFNSPIQKYTLYRNSVNGIKVDTCSAIQVEISTVEMFPFVQFSWRRKTTKLM